MRRKLNLQSPRGKRKERRGTDKDDDQKTDKQRKTEEEEEEKEADREIERLQKTREVQSGEYEKLDEQKKAAEAALQAFEDGEDIPPELKDRAEEAQTAVEEHEAELNRITRRKAQGKLGIQALVVKRDSLAEMIKEQTEQAKETSEERVESDKRATSIDRKLNEYIKRVEKERKKKKVDPVKAEREYREAYETYKKHVNIYKMIMRRREDMQDRLQSRHDNARIMSKLLGINTRRSFKRYLTNRGHSGNLTFNFSKGTLHISVEIDGIGKARNKNKAGKDDHSGDMDKLKGLSGGERSYSTICFLLALWDNIQTPFICMDEWDVFMDSKHRKEAMDMIFEKACSNSSNEERQYIMLSPGDMGDVARHGDRVKAIRLADPERGSD